MKNINLIKLVINDKLVFIISEYYDIVFNYSLFNII